MRRDEAILRLKLFAERFESLLESRFYRRAVDEGWGVTVSFDPERPMEPEHSGAREKDCKDFVSDLRLFFHKGEILNLGDLPAAYAALEMPSELICELEEALSSLRRFREGITPFILGKDRVSRAKLFHIFVYGSLAHVNPEKREIYEKWKSNPGIFALLESHFLQNLFQHVELLFRIYSVNSEALLLIA